MGVHRAARRGGLGSALLDTAIGWVMRASIELE